MHNLIIGILNIATGGLLDKVLNFFSQRETERLESMSEARKQEYADQRDRRMRANEIRLATAGFWEMRLLTAWVLFIFVFHLTSIWLDTQFALGWAIAKFPDPIDDYEWQIILSLFGLGVANRALTTVAAVFRK
jgi:hypothetical protein